MRFLPAAFSALFALSTTLFATDFPTVKAPLPAIDVPRDSPIAAIDLRAYFEVTSVTGQVVQFRTSLGTYNVEMLPAAAPASVTNFLSYVNGGRYANTFIHRSDKGLGVIQGGGYAVTNPNPISVGRIATDAPIALEYNLPNVRGAIAMARTSALNSATSEWFINTVDNSVTLGAGNNGGYAVFGRVIGTGMNVVDAIQALPVYNAGSPYTQLPLIGTVGANVVFANFVMMLGNEAVPIFPASAGQNAVVTFSVTNSDPGLVTATVSGSSLNLALASGESGFADVKVTATDTNGNAVENTFRLTVTPPPHLIVEQPSGAEVTNSGSKAFPVVNVGGSADLTFTIKNTGEGNLRLLGTPKVAVGGHDASMFTVTAQPDSPIAAATGSTSFTVHFAPTSSGEKVAALHVATNDIATSSFDLNLTGIGNVAPTLTLPTSPVIAEATSAAGAAVSFSVAANDEEDGALIPSVEPASGTSFAIGDTVANVSATDTRGAVTTGSFVVRVRDTTAPSLTPPASLVMEPTSATGVVVHYPAATASDAVGVTSLTYSAASGATFPIGKTTVEVTAKDAANNTTIRTFTVTVGFQRPPETTLLGGAQSGDPAPGAGTDALPADAVMTAFGAPALSDFRDLAARVTMLAGRTKLTGIYTENDAGVGTLATYQGSAVPGVGGATFKSFLDPVIAADGAIAFGATVQGAGIKGTTDFGVWTNAFGPALEPALREGSDVPGLPPGARLKSVTSLSIRDGELLALLKLSPAAGVVTAGDDTVLLRMTDATTATVLLREGRELAGFPGSKIKTFSVLSPALGSPGQGRWHADGAVVAKVTLFDKRTLLVNLAPDGTATPLLSTADPATPIDAAARWKTFGLPAVDSIGAHFVTAATLQAKLGGVATGNDSALGICSDGATWNVFAREGDSAPVTPAGPSYAAFFDPLVNDAGHVAFLATLKGGGVKGTNKTALFSGLPGNLRTVARLGDFAADENGAATGATWSKFLSCALAGGPGGDVIFLAEMKGGGTTAKTKLGLWAVDSQGTLRRLLRTGVSLSPDGAPVTNLTLLNAVPGAYGAARSYNATGSVALLATFADKSQTLVRVDLP